MKIAIIGSGSAGTSAGLYLNRSGHEVQIFEREESPKPVGSGIMLQPTGLKSLADFGLDKRALTLGCKINGIDGETIEGWKILDLDFLKKDKYFGLGIYRGALYQLMLDAVIEKGIEVTFGAEIVSLRENKNNTTTLVSKDERQYTDFDLVVCANGARSLFRKHYKLADVDRAQGFGALWTKIPYDNALFKNKIHQYYQGTDKMLGFMPMGKFEENSEEYVNFFWSISVPEIEKWKKSEFSKWKDEVIAFAPKHEAIISKIESREQIMVAPYLDVVLKPSYSGNVVFIGDAAHPMSPQLAQGAGFAMLDARMLSECLQAYPRNLGVALAEYHKTRSKQVYFYQKVSRLITPYFQSVDKSTWFRDRLFTFMNDFSVSRNIMIDTILGFREGVFSNLDKRYYDIS